MSTTTISNPGSAPATISRARRDEDPALEMESIDLERLAEELIVLFKRELRLERERRGSEWR